MTQFLQNYLLTITALIATLYILTEIRAHALTKITQYQKQAIQNLETIIQAQEIIIGTQENELTLAQEELKHTQQDHILS
jgi:hypothetical protein